MSRIGVGFLAGVINTRGRLMSDIVFTFIFDSETKEFALHIEHAASIIPSGINSRASAGVAVRIGCNVCNLGCT